jgi:hypothetical protein
MDHKSHGARKDPGAERHARETNRTYGQTDLGQKPNHNKDQADSDQRPRADAPDIVAKVSVTISRTRSLAISTRGQFATIRVWK